MKMKQIIRNLGLSILLTGSAFAGYGQVNATSSGWSAVAEQEIPVSGKRLIQPDNYRTFGLQTGQMRQQLALATSKQDPSGAAVYIYLPKPDGRQYKYRVYTNTTMHPGLAAQFAEIRTYDAVGVDQPGDRVKLDLTLQGFHAMILSPGKPTIFIDPYAFGGGDTQHYIVYDRSSLNVAREFHCQFESLAAVDAGQQVQTTKSLGSCELRTFRLALTATGEYTAFHGGTVPLALSAQVTTMNRVNGVFERDIAVTMTIIPNNNLLIYTDESTDPFTNGDPGLMIDENQNIATSVIGTANFDIGHIFGTNSGGLAAGGICLADHKAKGVTGSGAPIGDSFDIDYVAHEMGHQFHANHTFNNSCDGNRNDATAMEPGSGTTIMAYAGICAPDIQAHSDDHFHGISLEEMAAFITSSENSCSVNSPLDNIGPSISGTTGSGVFIPANTPFALTANAVDMDGDVLTYCWEQTDAQVSTQPPLANATGGPNFRSFSPSENPTRYFPAISTLMSGSPSTWEVLPSANRTMSFRVVVRDNADGGGCNDHADITMTTTSTAGPFLVNYPSAASITWAGNTSQTVTWSVANTDVAPVACSNVNILLSTDGGITFTTLATNVPNDGSQPVNVPNVATTTAIVMVICANGTFFDISNNYLTITATTFDYTLTVAEDSIAACQSNNAVYDLNIGSIGGYSDAVQLTTVGLPAPATATFAPASVNPGNASQLTVSNTATIAPGNYTFTIQANSTSGIKTVEVQLHINDSSPEVPFPIAPSNVSANVSTPVTFSWLSSGNGVLYRFEAATDGAFTNLVAAVDGLTATSITVDDLLAQTTYFWRVRAYTDCDTTSYSNIFTFSTSACFTAANATDVVIPENGAPTITSTLVVGSTGTIGDVNLVGLTGTHSWIADMTVSLTSPAGTTVVLFNNICGDVANFDLNLDDEATPGSLPCPPVGGGFYQPSNPLSAFDGEDPAGTWTLTIADNSDGDGGALQNWGLQICLEPETPCVQATQPVVAATTLCPGGTATLSITSGNLNDAVNWYWYAGSCGGTPIGAGTSITVNATGNYFVRGEGACTLPENCVAVVVSNTVTNTGITNNQNQLSASQNGAAYQWINCINNSEIAGATAQSFTPTQNGQYAVIVTFNNCSDTSNCLTISTVGIPENELRVLLYPNPTKGIVTLDFGQEQHISNCTVTDAVGRIIVAETDLQLQQYVVDLSAESAGVYFLNLSAGTETQVFKIIRQ
jgi:subtilisin-like proprotein convertase family protein